MEIYRSKLNIEYMPLPVSIVRGKKICNPMMMPLSLTFAFLFFLTASMSKTVVHSRQEFSTNQITSMIHRFFPLRLRFRVR